MITTTKSVLNQATNGESKDNILANTGHTVGLSDISLTIEAGEIFVIMGLSGSGKSTLIRHFNRLIDPTDGEIFVDGEDILSFDKVKLNHLRRAKMSMVFQRFALLPHRNVRDNVAFGLEIHGVDQEQRYAAAEEWIDTVGLTGYED